VARDLSARQPVVVECLGLPGVGKSHVTRLLAARLATTGVPAGSALLSINHDYGRWRRIVRKSGMGAVEVTRAPRRALRVARMLMRSGQQSRVDVVRLAYNWFVYAALVRRARSQPRVELLDEGLFQLLWSAGFAGRDRAIHDCAAALVETNGATPDVVVLVEAPVNAILNRLERRSSGGARIDRMTIGVRHAALDRGAGLLAEVLSEKRALFGSAATPIVRTIRNEGAEALDADIDALARELASLAS